MIAISAMPIRTAEVDTRRRATADGEPEGRQRNRKASGLQPSVRAASTIANPVRFTCSARTAPSISMNPNE